MTHCQNTPREVSLALSFGNVVSGLSDILLLAPGIEIGFCRVSGEKTFQSVIMLLDEHAWVSLQIAFGDGDLSLAAIDGDWQESRCVFGLA